MICLYADEQFPLPVVEKLRSKGYNILTVKEAGKANQRIPDEEVLAFATSQSRAVITQNRRDFIGNSRKTPAFRHGDTRRVRGGLSARQNQPCKALGRRAGMTTRTDSKTLDVVSDNL